MLTWALCYLYVNVIRSIREGGKLVFPDYLFIISMVFDLLVIATICYSVCYIFKNEGDDIL